MTFWIFALVGTILFVAFHVSDTLKCAPARRLSVQMLKDAIVSAAPGDEKHVLIFRNQTAGRFDVQVLANLPSGTPRYLATGILHGKPIGKSNALSWYLQSGL